MGRGYGNSSNWVNIGVYGFGENLSNGGATGGYFTTSSSGTGNNFGILADGRTSAALTTYGAYCTAHNDGSGHNAIGVEGDAYNSSGSYTVGGSFFASGGTSGNHYGVIASVGANSNSSAYGLYGASNNGSTGASYGGYFKTDSSGTGIHYGARAEGYASSSANTYGSYGYASNSSSGNVYGGYFAADSAGSGAGYGVYAQASVVYWAGWFQGDLGVSHNLYVYGSKSSAVKVNTGEYRAFYSQESPENWFEDFGEGQLANGKAHIDLEPLFLQTVTINSLNPMKVFVQLEGDCNGVFVTKGTNGFDVTELKGGSSSVSFSYRVVAKRKGYEKIRLAKMKGPSPEEMAFEQAKHQTEFAKEETKRQEERKRKDETRASQSSDTK